MERAGLGQGGVPSSSSSASGAAKRARQLAFVGDVPGALAALQQGLAEDEAQPRLWLLLGDLLADGGGEAPSIAGPNPSGLGTRGGGRPRDAAGAAAAYGAACRHGRRLGERGVVEAARENLQRLLRRTLGHSPGLILEALWDRDRGRFVTSEARRAAAALKARGGSGRIAACVMGGAGWEGTWLARHADALGLLSVFSVHGPRTSALLPFERSLAEANGVQLACLGWDDLGAHLDAARPSAMLVVLGSCLGAFPVPPAAVLAEVFQLHAALGRHAGGAAAAFVPATVSWRGGAAAGPLLRSVGTVDVEQMRGVGLDYSLAAEALQPGHAWVSLGEGGAQWEDRPLLSLCLEDAWRGASSGQGQEECLEAALRSAATPAGPEPSPAFAWWTQAEAAGAAVVSSAPRAGPPRTWQFVVFGEGLEARGVGELLAAAAAPARFRGYHVGMLNDRSRTASYDAALQEALAAWPEGEAVLGLDIGAGTGLLAMLLARHARARGLPSERTRVVAVEAEGELAAVAGRLAAANGVGDVVEVHNVLSTQLGPGLPGCRPGAGTDGAAAADDAEGGPRANLCVHEVFGSDPLSERLLPSLRHARRELLATDCRLVPRRIKIWCALCCGRALRCAFVPPAGIEGVRCLGEAFADVAPVVEALAVPPAEPQGDAGGAPIAWLTEATEAAALDLWELPEQVPLELEVRLRGPPRGTGGAEPAEEASTGVFLASWFSVDGPVPMDTGPGTDGGAGLARPWAPVFQHLPGATLPSDGEPFVAEVALCLAEDRVRYHLRRVALEDAEEAAAELAPLFAEDA